MSQLVLPLRLSDHAVFASFHTRGNEPVVAALEDLAADSAAGPGCWLWGGPSTGKTHLLQAVCDAAGDRSAYVPLATLGEVGPDILEGLENRELVCIDDIDTVASDGDWEFALFSLCNQLADAGGQLLISARSSPRECALRLPDLASRMSRLAVYQLRELQEQDRVTALQLRAAHRGLELPDETANYLLRRSRRDMASLYGLLDRLDLEALRAQRRLTVPFVRDVLAGDGPA